MSVLASSDPLFLSRIVSTLEGFVVETCRCSVQRTVLQFVFVFVCKGKGMFVSVCICLLDCFSLCLSVGLFQFVSVCMFVSVCISL